MAESRGNETPKSTTGNISYIRVVIERSFLEIIQILQIKMLTDFQLEEKKLYIFGVSLTYPRPNSSCIHEIISI